MRQNPKVNLVIKPSFNRSESCCFLTCLSPSGIWQPLGWLSRAFIGETLSEYLLHSQTLSQTGGMQRWLRHPALASLEFCPIQCPSKHLHEELLHSMVREGGRVPQCKVPGTPTGRSTVPRGQRRLCWGWTLEQVAREYLARRAFEAAVWPQVFVGTEPDIRATECQSFTRGDCGGKLTYYGVGCQSHCRSLSPFSASTNFNQIFKDELTFARLKW